MSFNLGGMLRLCTPLGTKFSLRERERRARDLRAGLAVLDAGPAVCASRDTVRAEALRLLED